MNRGVALAFVALVAILGGIWGYQSGTGGHMMGSDQMSGGMGDGHRQIDTTPVVEVAVPEITGVALEGKALFDNNCAACHGKNAAGNEGKGPPLIHRIYEPNHHGDAAIYLAAERGVRQHHWPYGDMPPVDGVTRDDVAKIITYIRTIQRANGIN